MVQIEKKIIDSEEGFPNNPKLPLLHYINVLEEKNPSRIQAKFEENGWVNSWVDSIYSYHHFHSNTHEALGIAKGSCEVQLGGPKGLIMKVSMGDVLVIPAGVAHKRVQCSPDFICIGCYPTEEPYNMHKEIKEGIEDIKKQIDKVPIPAQDPVFGDHGPLLSFWDS